MNTEELPQKTVTPEEAARMLNISIRTLRRWIPPKTWTRKPGRVTEIDLDLVRSFMPTPGGDDVVTE